MPRKISGKRSQQGSYTGDNARTGQIRWRKRDLEKIERTINNFNKRLYRQQKKNTLGVVLPERRKKSVAIKEIQTRAEFNRFIKDLESFTAETAKPVTLPDNNKVTQWQVNRAKKNDARYQKDKEAFQDYLDNKTILIGGKDTGNIKKYSFKTDKEIQRLSSPRNPEEMKLEEFLKFDSFAERRLLQNYKMGKERKMVENYIRGLMRVGYSDDLIMMIGRVPPEKFLEIIETDTMAEFDFIYDPIELAAREEQIRNAFEAYATDEQYIDFYDIMDIAADVQEKVYQGYYGRDYQNRNRKYRWKKRRKK